MQLDCSSTQTVWSVTLLDYYRQLVIVRTAILYRTYLWQKFPIRSTDTLALTQPHKATDHVHACYERLCVLAWLLHINALTFTAEEAARAWEIICHVYSPQVHRLLCNKQTGMKRRGLASLQKHRSAQMSVWIDVSQLETHRYWVILVVRWCSREMSASLTETDVKVPWWCRYTASVLGLVLSGGRTDARTQHSCFSWKTVLVSFRC